MQARKAKKGSRGNTPVELSVGIIPVHDVQGSHVAPDGASMQAGDDSAPLQGAAPVELGARQAQLEAALQRKYLRRTEHAPTRRDAAVTNSA